jgi:hypothetical protein
MERASRDIRQASFQADFTDVPVTLPSALSFTRCVHLPAGRLHQLGAILIAVDDVTMSTIRAGPAFKTRSTWRPDRVGARSNSDPDAALMTSPRPGHKRATGFSSRERGEVHGHVTAAPG